MSQKGFENSQTRENIHQYLSFTECFQELTKYGGQDIRLMQKNLRL